VTGVFTQTTKISQSSDFENVFCGQDRNDQFSLWSGMHLIQVMLTAWLRHELPDAVVQTALSYLIRASTVREANALIAD
jgi:hypothetical protein